MAAIEELCDAVLAARDKKDTAKANLDRADEEFRAAEKSLVSAMLDIGQDKATQGGFNFATKHKVSWKAPSANQSAMLTVLRAEAPEVIRETVHPATLTKFMNQTEDGLSDDGPGWWSTLRELVERKESTVLSLTKGRKKK